MGTCITKSIKQYSNIKFQHGRIIQNGKSERRLQKFEVVLSAFLNLKKKGDFGGQEIPYFDCVNPEGTLIFRSTG